jgi:phosphoglycerate kinase
VSSFKTLDDLGDVAGKRALVRVDLNVPMADGAVTDDTRLRSTLPTVTELADRGAIVLLLAHFGRPKGARSPDMSLSLVTRAYEDVLGRPVRFVGDCAGPLAADNVAQLQPGDIAILENTRFHAGEEKNDPELAREMAALGDLYVNDAFSAAHRAHSSTEAIARLLPAYAGRAMEAELKALEKALGQPERPVAAVVGGAKVSTKLDVLRHLVAKVDHLIIGGGMANTFLAARGVAVGKSLCEHDLTDTALAILDAAERANCTVHLPYDVVVAKEFAPNPPSYAHLQRPRGRGGRDDPGCRPGRRRSACRCAQDLPDLGLERPARRVRNAALRCRHHCPRPDRRRADPGRRARLRGRRRRHGCALNHAGVADRFTFVSTAGGAFLEWMEGKDLPGVAALQQTA